MYADETSRSIYKCRNQEKDCPVTSNYDVSPTTQGKCFIGYYAAIVKSTIDENETTKS